MCPVLLECYSAVPSHVTGKTFVFPHTNPSLIVSSQLAFLQPLRNYNSPRHPIKHVKLNYPVSQDADLLASWWRTQRAHQWEAYRRATAPSPLSTRRASMKTKEKHCDTHIKGACVVLALDITQQTSLDLQHMTAWKLDHRLFSHLPPCHPRLSVWHVMTITRITALEALYMLTAHSCSIPHQGTRSNLKI